VAAASRYIPSISVFRSINSLSSCVDGGAEVPAAANCVAPRPPVGTDLAGGVSAPLSYSRTK
jgi:hypothetical protein